MSVSRYAMAVNSPYSVGSRTVAVRSTSFSLRRRYSTRSATVIILSPCRSQYGMRSGTRAIVPSSFMTSHTTPAGVRPASWARSTAASVCPIRSSTPPGRARSGGCGRLRSDRAGRTRGRSRPRWCALDRPRRRRSDPSRASIVVVYAVPCRDSRSLASRRRFSSSCAPPSGTGRSRPARAWP